MRLISSRRKVSTSQSSIWCITNADSHCCLSVSRCGSAMNTMPLSPHHLLCPQHVKFGVDSTFLPLLEAPFDPAHCNTNSPTKTAWKFEIVCDLAQRIVNVSKACRSAVRHAHHRESGTLLQASATSPILGDKEYDGPLGIVSPVNKKNEKPIAAGTRGDKGEGV
jgi:hypothetical protein